MTEQVVGPFSEGAGGVLASSNSAFSNGFMYLGADTGADFIPGETVAGRMSRLRKERERQPSGIGGAGVPWADILKPPIQPTGAIDFLERAADLMHERGKEYDTESGERSMASTVKAFNAITGRDLTEAEGWAMMLVLKLVRQSSKKGFHRDSAEDAVAYASLYGEALAKKWE